MVEKKKTKTKKTDPGLYNGAEIAAALGRVGARVGELECNFGVLVGRINKHQDEIADLISALECRDAALKKALAELASTVATAASSTGTPIGDGAMLRAAIKAAVKAELDEIVISISQGVVAGTGDELRKFIREELEADRKANPLRR